MHILILPSWYPRDENDVTGVFFRDQAMVLHNYGHKVGVIAPIMRSLRTIVKGKLPRSLVRFEEDSGLPTYRRELFAALPRVPYGNYQLFKMAAKELFRHYIAEHGAPDIIHAHSSVFAGAASVEISSKLDIPLVLTEHSTAFARGSYSPWQLRLAEKAIKQASSCIAVSPSLAELLGSQFPIRPAGWQWIPNVVADRFMMPESSDRPERPVRFLNLALMTEKKGHFDLLEAFRQIRSLGLDAELWLAGCGPIRSDLEQMAGAIGILDKVRFLGLVPPADVPALMAKADVMVISSHYETFGVVAAEALMTGLPVVATRCGGPECIVEVGDGLLVAPKRPADLADAMQKVAENLSDYNAVTISERAKARFSGAAVAVRLTEVYQNVLS